MDVNYKLKARIIECYRNQNHYAVCAGREKSWISRIIQGQQLPTPKEKLQFQMKLRIPDEDTHLYFPEK